MKQVQARVTLTTRSQRTADRVATRLRELGLRIVRVRPRAVTVAAGQKRFEEVFECQVEETDGAFVVRGEARVPESLREDASSVYVPTRPIYF